MSSYRFCRTDDIGLLVDALNRCWAPYVPDEPAMDAAAFKRSIRDLQVWCSSCMVAFSGPDPIGVLIGAKRQHETLVHRIAVHPDHVRQGHGRHLLDSLSAKLAILGPPRLVAEAPAHLTPACALFTACGFDEDTILTDYVRTDDVSGAQDTGAARSSAPHDARGTAGDAAVGEPDETFLIPVSVDDLAANGALDEVDRDVCWTRSLDTLTAAKADLAGLAVASENRLEAYVLYTRAAHHAELFALRAIVDDGERHLRRLCETLRAMGVGTLRLPKIHPAEISPSSLDALGFRPANRHRRFTGLAAELAARAAS